ncbi:hypothetical protein P170DRAFT_510309 [Aspergillus steynii IBT 23096]|uniref:Uncharacterized protein n=1 Tax=Aspergillus steynii IBT 23096 TaxID=1392250 RepID=A0A2I2G3L8_9EURO|nr:uncharacterized protein P170DRAFT_510309 [Aspergillus steynii IBT 23096]PLB47475.1 hypothetical protein P170DRAFT_510309 [Aspergillus steynii IBT 23096]
MIPKICYLLFYFFLSLVVGSPVALQARAPPSLGITKQTIQSGGRNPWTAFGSVLTLEENAKISKEQLAGIVKAAYGEMSTLEPDVAKRPNVMTALQVGNEVILSSNMKGGGGVYVYNMQEQPLENKKNPNEDVVENGYGAFTDVLEKNAREVKDVLDSLRETSRNLQNSQQSSTQQSNGKQPAQPSNNGQGNRNGQKGSARKSPNDLSQELKGSRQTSFQHKNDANCGEVMASIRYNAVHKNGKLKNLTPKPMVVAWSESEKNGKMVGSIRAPCEKGQTLDGNSDLCGLSWGCGAFTGAQGMNWDVVATNTKPTEVTDAKFPKFQSKAVDLPAPTIKKKTNNNNGGGRNTNSNQPAAAPNQPAPKQPAPKQQPAQQPAPKADPKPAGAPASAPKTDPKKPGKKGGGKKT